MEKIKRITSVAVLAAFLISCSVKESRDGSPCWVMEHCSDAIPLTLSIWRDGRQLGSADTFRDGITEFGVQRGSPVLSSAVTISSNTVKCRSGVSVREQCQPDSIFAYLGSVTCTDECVHDTIVLHKQFTTVTVTIDISLTHPRFPDSLLITGDSYGVDLLTLEPLQGISVFTVPCRHQEESFRMVRQRGDSLSIRMLDSTGRTLGNVDLDRLLRNARYDWNAEDLEDIDITITGAGIKYNVTVLDWIDGEPITEEL